MTTGRAFAIISEYLLADAPQHLGGPACACSRVLECRVVRSCPPGRGHFGRVFSALVAGGGFKGGQVVGASDARGEDVQDRPVHPSDLIGTMYDLLGIDPEAKLPHPEGLDVRAIPTVAADVKSGGRLNEIT